MSSAPAIALDPEPSQQLHAQSVCGCDISLEPCLPKKKKCRFRCRGDPLTAATWSIILLILFYQDSGARFTVTAVSLSVLRPHQDGGLMNTFIPFLARSPSSCCHLLQLLFRIVLKHRCPDHIPQSSAMHACSRSSTATCHKQRPCKGAPPSPSLAPPPLLVQRPPPQRPLTRMRPAPLL